MEAKQTAETAGKEYRIRAYFTDTYPPRSYKRKIFHSREEAEAMYPEAREYYSGHPYTGRLLKVVIESRPIVGWEEEKVIRGQEGEVIALNEAIRILNTKKDQPDTDHQLAQALAVALSVLKKQEENRWTPVTERLPKVGEKVYLSTNSGEACEGSRDNPVTIRRCRAEGGKMKWVYDPENYTDDIDSLPKAEDCAFSVCDDTLLAVTSPNYEEEYAGVTAWHLLPEPYTED